MTNALPDERCLVDLLSREEAVDAPENGLVADDRDVVVALHVQEDGVDPLDDVLVGFASLAGEPAR